MTSARELPRIRDSSEATCSFIPFVFPVKQSEVMDEEIKTRISFYYEEKFFFSKRNGEKISLVTINL